MRTRTLSIEQTRLLDARAERDFSIPRIILMENAGIGLANHIRNFIIPPIHKCRVVMICGTGNNGGDTFAAARHLFQKGAANPDIFLVGDESRMTAEASVNFRIIKKLEIPILPFSAFQTKQREWSGLPVLIVDGILGIGFTPPLREPVADAIRQINRFKKTHNVSVRVLSVDIPSGLHGDLGVVGPDVVQAEITVTLACLKEGMLKLEAQAVVGRIEVVDIGIPEKLMASV